MANIVIFGDSITWGACDYKNGGWANLLKNYFKKNEEALGFDFSVYNLGISGDNTEDILKRFDIEAQAREPEIIIFAVGVNDTQRINEKTNPRIDAKTFEENYRRLIEKSKKLTSKIICLGLTPVDETKSVPIPWSPEKSYYNEFIQEYDKIIQKIAQEERLEYIPLYEQLDARNFEDGLHPETDDHIIIFEAVKQSLLAGFQ